MSPKPELPIIAFASPQDWESWLAEQHETSNGVWLKLARKDTGIASVSYAEALDVALCYGWIDGQKAAFDGQFWLQRFTPRTTRSKWSQVNRDKVAVLVTNNRMKPAGIRQVDLAKADGRWDAAYESQSKAVVPEDLQRALDENETAREFFATLDSANRYAILYRLHEAKKPETRARRLEKFIAMLNQHQKIHN